MSKKKNNTIKLRFERSEDAEGRDSLTIIIDDKAVFIPTEIITDFLEGGNTGVTITIPNEED